MTGAATDTDAPAGGSVGHSRVSVLGQESPQLFDSVVDVEPSSPLNCNMYNHHELSMGANKSGLQLDSFSMWANDVIWGRKYFIIWLAFWMKWLNVLANGNVMIN